jgi:hypothetical protein
MKPIKKKMKLDKDTVAVLTANELTAAAGGANNQTGNCTKSCTTLAFC